MKDLRANYYALRSTPYVLLLILLLGAALRLVGLGEGPPGLYHDEAYYGLDALSVLGGERPIFFEANNGREPLFIYLVALSINTLGRTPVAIRLVAAMVGSLTIPAVFLMGRALFTARIGLLAAALTAISVWTINLSRVGFRAVTMPLVLALCLWQTALAWQTGRRRHVLAAGALYGLLFYTYLAARFTPIAVAAVIVVVWLGQRSRATGSTPSVAYLSWLFTVAAEFIRRASLGLLAALVVAAPLFVYMATHLSDTLTRGGQVSILNPAIHQGDPLGLLVRQVGQTLGMFNVAGDFIPRHNVPWRPVFDPLLGLAFLGGLALALRRWRQPAYGFCLAWTAVMLLPTILAEDAPHFLRAVGILPVVMLFPALGLDALWTVVAARGRAVWGTALVSLALLIGLGWTLHDYFWLHARSDRAYYQFETGATELVRELNQFVGAGWQGGWAAAPLSRPTLGGAERHAFVAERLWYEWANIRFLAAPQINLAAPDRALGGTDILVALSPFADNQAVLALLPTPSLIEAQPGALEQGDLEPAPRLLYYTIHASPEPPPPTRDANFGPTALVDAQVRRSDSIVQVRLVWRSSGPLPATLSAFVHVVGPAGLLEQADGPPGGLYPGSLWRSGDTIAEDRAIIVPQDLPLTEVRIGLYDTFTLQRLRLPTGADFVSVPQSR